MQRREAGGQKGRVSVWSGFQPTLEGGSHMGCFGLEVSVQENHQMDIDRFFTLVGHAAISRGGGTHGQMVFLDCFCRLRDL